jgi:phage FluMu gp28-like protein
VSGNPDSAAGYTGNVLWDEAALTPRADELFGTAFPVISRGGWRFIIMSTPRPGFFRKMWNESQRPDSIWGSDKMDIYDAVEQGCPQDPAMLQRALRNNELRWRQEFLCEFIDDDICWLPWDMIVACTDSSASTTPEDSEDEVYAGWDVARWHDLSVLYLVRRSGTLLVTCGVLTMRRIMFDDQIDLILRTLKRHQKFIRLCVDAGGMGEMPAEQIAKKLPGKIEPVKFTNAVKAVLAGDIRRLMEDRTFRVPDDEEVRADLHSVRCTTTAAGNRRFEGDFEGSHADIFWAASLALHAAITRPYVPFEFTPAGECVYAAEGVL